MARRAAGPPGRRVLEALRKESARGWPDGLTLLAGDDLYHLDAALALLVARLRGEDAGDYAVEIFDRERVDVAQVVAAARSAGMFASRRVVVVRDAALLDGEPETLESYAAGPPARSHLLVRAPSLDQRRKLHQALARLGRSLVFSVPASPALAVETARAMAAERGLELDRAAEALLIEIHGGDPLALAAELEKLAAWLGGKGRSIGIEALRAVGAGGAVLSTWETADAIVERDRGRALAGVRALVDSGEEPVRLVGALAFRARALFEARARRERGEGVAASIQGVRGVWGSTAKVFERALPGYSMDEMLAQPSALLEADRTLKSRSIAPRCVLERLVDRLTAKGEPR